jgi:hypothetical protein
MNFSIKLKHWFGLKIYLLRFKLFIIASLIISVLWSSSGIIINSISASNRGTFGDMFGAINALFSGLAFAGVIYTILLQRQELKLQRKELKLTRQELKRTAKAQEDSEKALNTQAKAYVLSAIINGQNSFAHQMNRIIDDLQQQYDSYLGPSDYGNSLKDEIQEKKKQLNIHLKIIQNSLDQLHKLEEAQS